MKIPERYSVENLRRAIRNPSLLVTEGARLAHKTALQINRNYYRMIHSPDQLVMCCDWDNLLILDGCRFDTFYQTATIPGTTNKRISGASESWEFLRRNFEGKRFHDTVYITANPHWYELTNDIFHSVVDLLSCAWDEEIGTVRPQDVVDEAQRVHELFPNKRLIVHFMQPHFPFLGESADKISHKGLTKHLDEEDPQAPNVWSATRRKKISSKLVQQAYVENLQIVLEEVEKLHSELSGLTVVTADHGNLMGDRLRPIPIREYGHPPTLYAPPLVEVPWHVMPFKSRRETVSTPPTGSKTDISDAEISDRLHALGYK